MLGDWGRHINGKYFAGGVSIDHLMFRAEKLFFFGQKYIGVMNSVMIGDMVLVICQMALRCCSNDHKHGIRGSYQTGCC
jgi:hypothetical protein